MSNIDGPKPDLVVGIDFGMTGSAVAWALPSVDKVNSITTWPGSDGKPTEAPKTPSAVSLCGLNGAWGFRAFAEGVAEDSVQRLFKPWLDEDFSTLAEAPRNTTDVDFESIKGEDDAAEKTSCHDIDHDHIRMEVSEAEKCLEKYLSGLYDYIKESLKGQLCRDWFSTTIWFRFSYPATWDQTTTSRFERIIEAANFSQGRNHKVSALSLNEAEAAMASFFVEQTRPSVGQKILVADLGGCTTDVSTFEVDRDDGNRVAMRQLSDSDALYNGSRQIDGAVRNELHSTIREKIASLENFRHLSGADKLQHAHSEVRRIIREDQNYIDAKYGFKPDTETCKVLLGLKNQNGQPVTKVQFDLAKALRKALEQQCMAVWSQIEGHVDFQPKVGSLDVMVLTGGVSNNKYIHARLEKQAEKYHVPEVMVPETPELAVSRGLVHEALESINRYSVFRYESSFFYGVVISSPTSPTGKNTLTKLVSKGKTITTTDFRKAKTITLPTVDVDIRLVRWSERTGASNNEEVGCLTHSLPDGWAWKKSMFGQGLNTDVEVTFDRRTISVTLEGDGGERHTRVFNEAWHTGAVPPVRRKRDHPILKTFLTLLGPMAAIAGIVTKIVMDGDSGEGEQ